MMNNRHSAPHLDPISASIFSQRPPQLPGISHGGISFGSDFPRSQYESDRIAQERDAKPTKKPRERWTSEEHERFLDGLKMYHRDWRSIERHVGTKTAVQIRSHAQKFFAKAEREPGTVDFELPPPRPKRKSSTVLNSSRPMKAGLAATQEQSAIPQAVGEHPQPTAATLSNVLTGGIPQEPWNSGPSEHVPPTAEMLNKIAAAAVAAASTTAHAVISAAGPEYMQVIQDLAKHDQRLSFLCCPATDLISSFSPPMPADPPASDPPTAYQRATDTSPLPPTVSGGTRYASCDPGVFMPVTCSTTTTTGNPAGSGSARRGTSSMPDAPTHLLQLLSVQPTSSHLVDHLGLPDVPQLTSLRNCSVPSSVGLTQMPLLSSASAAFATPQHETFVHSPLPMPSVLATSHVPLSGAPTAPSVPALMGACMQAAQVSSPQQTPPGHMPPTSIPLHSTHMHVFPEHLPAEVGNVHGYGEQGSGGGSGGNSGAELLGSGDKSGSKSAKQSGNRKPDEGPDTQPLGDLPPNGVAIPLNNLTQQQQEYQKEERIEFYKQYYHEMIRRGAEGLRNMNIKWESEALNMMTTPHTGPSREPLESQVGGRLEKGSGWAIEVEQQDTATSAHDGCTIPESSHRNQNSGQVLQTEVTKVKEASQQPGSVDPNSSGEGSNEPGTGPDHDGSGSGAQPGDQVGRRACTEAE